MIGEFFQKCWRGVNQTPLGTSRARFFPKLPHRYTAMTKYDEGMSLSRKSGGGHLGVENTCILGWSHEKGHGRKNGPSLARASTKFKISQQYVYKTLRFKIILRYRPRKRVSYATKTRQIKIYALQPENQRKAKNTCCRKRHQYVNSLEFGTD